FVFLLILVTALHTPFPYTTLSRSAAGAQQRRVEHLGHVGRGQHDHARASTEAVHLGEYLVEGLLLLAAAAAEHGLAALAADGVEDRKSTRLNSSHVKISYAVFCLK